MIRLIIFFVSYVLLTVLTSCPALGQEQPKKTLTEADYDLWGTLKGENISNKGSWVSFHMSYPNSKDTLFLINTHNNQKFDFPGAVNGQFKEEELFVCQKKDTLVLLNLKTRKTKKIQEIKSFDFSKEGNFLTLEKNKNQLLIYQNDKIIDSINKLTSFLWNDQKNILGYTTKESFGYLELKSTYKKHTIVKDSTQYFKTLNWQPNGNTLACYDITENNEALYIFNCDTKKMNVLKATDKYFPKNRKIAPAQNLALSIAKDGEKVFFGITTNTPTNNTTDKEAVTIWNAQDKILAPNRKKKATIRYPQFLAVWIPKKEIVQQLSNTDFPNIILNGNQEYALISNPLQYEPQYKWIADTDYYELNIETGTKKLLLTQQSGFMSQIGCSPSGQHITYYNNRNWWIFDSKTNKHINLTQGLNTTWDTTENDPGNELKVWGNPGWSTDGKYVIFYDSHDIWQISLDGSLRKRLTNGKEKQLRYRLNANSIVEKTAIKHSGRGANTYDLSKDLILAVVDEYNGNTGYFKWCSKDNTLKKIMMNNSKTSNYKKAEKNNSFIVIQQKFNAPPALYFQKEGKIKKIYQSNKHHENYYWGHTEMIHYKDQKGNILNGALFYPAHFDQTKKYPLIVYIYDKVAKLVHDYVNPSLQNGIGFNCTNLTNKGYFVLMADIAYEKGNPGNSAVECVTAAVDKVLETSRVNPDKIGLIGHSFGGYEVNFITTQTDKFAAVVSGSGIADNVAHYFTYNTEQHSIDSWRFENQQFRMGVPFFENQQAYFDNSPLLHAEKITTPILTWTGDSDKNVQPKQSEAWYAALRRLKKEHIMLVYPNEGHMLQKDNNQRDLTHKIYDWFDYYLKNTEKPEWMKTDYEIDK